MNDSIGLIGSEMSRYPQSGGKKPRLFDQVRQKIQALHYSPRTGKTYTGWIKRFILFIKKTFKQSINKSMQKHSSNPGSKYQ